jgi:uncharacterized protein YifE (UPF0438 family)
MKSEHLAYLKNKGTFRVDCSHKIFSDDEIAILEKYGHWFQALETGELMPYTDLQKEFVRVARGERGPFSVAEKAWFKYKGRKALEAADVEGRLKREYIPEDDTFYNRDMTKSVRSTMFKVNLDNHKS